MTKKDRLLKKACFVLPFLLLHLTIWPTVAQASATPKQFQVRPHSERIFQKISDKETAAWQRLQWALVSPMYGLLPTPSSTKPRVAAVPKLAPDTPTTSSPSNIDLTPDTKKRLLVAEKKTAEELREEWRQRIALWHQALGIGAMILMAATVILGQINVIDFLEDRLSPQPMLWAHRIAAIGTTVSYSGARILAWMLPKPEADDDYQSEGFDSAKVHGLLSWIHGIGMLALLVGGIINARAIPAYTVGKKIFTVSHLVGGYVTLVSLAGAFIVISFF